jgi:hypothetical protein
MTFQNKELEFLAHADTTDNACSGPQWAAPKDIPTKLAKVADFSIEFLPPSIGPWVGNISERLQCPPDYVAVTALTALGALIGRRVGIKPQRKTDWLEVPNVWGCFVGKPGMLKSPAMMEALKPLHRLDAEAAKAHAAALVDHQATLAEFKLHKSVKESVLKEELKKKVAEKIVSLGGVSSIKDAIKGAQKEDPFRARRRSGRTEACSISHQRFELRGDRGVAGIEPSRAPGRARRARLAAQAPRSRSSASRGGST